MKGRASRSILITTQTSVEEYSDAITAEHAHVGHWCRLIDSERQQQLIASSQSLQLSVNAHSLATENLSLNGENSLGELQRLKHLLHSIERPLQRLADDAAETSDDLARTERLAVLRWLSSVPYREHHKTSAGKVLEKSGSWLLYNPKFRDWINSSSSSILWLHGIRKLYTEHQSCLLTSKI